MQQKEYFTRFPNDYIQGNIKTKFGISRKFYITYILIDKYRSYENYSWITIRKVLDFYGYKTHRNKPKAFQEILDVLEYMINNNMIEVQQDLDSIGYDTGIEIKIISENFDPCKDFSKLTSSQYDFIMMNESSINRENILVAFLYINSYIYIRQRDNNGNELLSKPQDKPEAFFRSIDSMSKELSMSKDTINQCIQFATTNRGGDVTVSIGDIKLDGIQNPDQFAQALIGVVKDYSKVQKVLQAATVDLVAGKSIKGLNRF